MTSNSSDQTTSLRTIGAYVGILLREGRRPTSAKPRKDGEASPSTDMEKQTSFDAILSHADLTESIKMANIKSHCARLRQILASPSTDREDGPTIGKMRQRRICAYDLLESSTSEVVAPHTGVVR